MKNIVFETGDLVRTETGDLGVVLYSNQVLIINSGSNIVEKTRLMFENKNIELLKLVPAIKLDFEKLDFSVKVAVFAVFVSMNITPPFSYNAMSSR